MKKMLLIFLLAVTSKITTAQIVKKDNQCIGFGVFALGDSKEKFNGHLHYLEKYTKDKREFSIYAFTTQDSGAMKFEGISFNSTIVIFNDSNQLISVVSIKFYRKQDSPNIKKDLKKDYEKIVSIATAAMNTKAVKKTYYKNSQTIERGEEWKGSTSVLAIKRKDAGGHSVLEVRLEYN